MTNQDDQIATAVEAERSRCVKLMEFYRREFEGTKLEHLWFRIRNQIAIGTDPEKADLASQFLEDDEADTDEDS